jgi:hypothetical protein
MSMATREQIESLAKSYSHWLSDPNIHGIFVEEKQAGGKGTGALAIVVHVSEKKATLSDTDTPIPPRVELHAQAADGTVSIEQVPTDVVESEPPRLLALDGRIRPAPGGYEISVPSSLLDERPGTLGVNIVWQGTFRLLTNNHVISANGNVGGTVYQPAQDVITDNSLATVTSYLPVVTYANRSQPNPVFNQYDIAWCDISTTLGATNIAEIGVPTGIRAPTAGEAVKWIGAATGQVQSTTINTLSGQLVLEFTSGQWAFFNNVITFNGGSSQQGDSGAAIMATSDNQIIGLIFAGAGSSPRAVQIP